jgi:hypothetical protein
MKELQLETKSSHKLLDCLVERTSACVLSECNFSSISSTVTPRHSATYSATIELESFTTREPNASQDSTMNWRSSASCRMQLPTAAMKNT